jgi:magnesium chelatase subunit I
MSISNYETLIANALRRAMRHGDGQAVPRISDLRALRASTQGKIEFEYAASHRNESEILDELWKRATKVVFDSVAGDSAAYQPIADAFDKGWMVEITDQTPAGEFLEGFSKIEGLRAAALKLSGGDSAPKLASAVELIFEGLHLGNKLNKNVSDQGVAYSRS